MSGQQWDPRLYDDKHAFVYEYGRDLLALLAPRPEERILDVGCGTGHLTAAIAQSGARVVGIDSSTEMIERASEAYPGLEFLVADARDFSLPGEFDAVFSNAALHWVREADAAAACIAAALKAGGRFVAEFAANGNVAAIIGAVQQALAQLWGKSVEHQWFFPALGQYAALLESYGFEVREARLYDRPTPLEEGEAGLRNWLVMFGSGLLGDLSAEQQQALFAHVEERLRPRLFHDGRWFADYRRLRLLAVKH